MFSKSGDRESDLAAAHSEDWLEPKKPKRDLKKVLLVLGLGGLSWVATYVGMLELIQANMGNLDFTTKIVVGFSVAMLMTMIIWLLDQMFAPHPFVVKLSYFFGYVFLTIISVGFGFGFYWKVLESRSEASRSAESAVSQVQASLLAGAARLDQLQGTLEQLTQISQQKAILERDSGTSCPNSRPGDGPRRRLRDDDAARFSFASNFVKGRSTQVKSDMKGLDADLKKIVNADASTFDKATGTRNKFLQALSRKLELTATSFNAFRTDPQLRQIRSELSERANRSTFPTGRGNRTFSCPDGQLQSALFGVVKAIDQLPELSKPEIATVEGAQAVVEAFRRLTATGAGLLVFKLPPSADELRALQSRAVRSVAPGAAKRRAVSAGGLSQGGLSQRDYIPLSIALFVDLCLLLVSIGRPMNRLGGLVPKMREAERGPVYQILSKFDDIHRDPKVREKFEVFRHVVFDFNGDYYVAVPLDAPRNRNPDEVKNLQLEAHLLANLFASFEKEKIFSRVYNPLLSRKTIQKKLWRQGSKFASSQAFRTYRFKDGAWSDIILGAVMGAARRANAERQKVAAEAGPQLDLPATASQSELEARAREIIAASVGQETAAVKEQLQEPAFNHAHVQAGRTGSVMPAATQMSNTDASHSAFGPYAGHPDAAHANASSSKPTMAWPYQKPPVEPGEADVDLMPANSNTSTGQGGPANRVTGGADQSPDESAGDNVILMPLSFEPSPKASFEDNTGTTDAGAPPPLPVTAASGERREPPPLTELLADAMTTAPLNTEAAPTAHVEAVQIEQAATPSQPGLETSMNVRITQRTADFQIPISAPMQATSNGLPVEFIRTGMRSALSQHAVPAEEMNAPDLITVDVQPSESADDNLSMQAVETASSVAQEEPVMLLDAPESIDIEEVTVSEQLEISQPEDDLVEISRRFAPKA